MIMTKEQLINIYKLLQSSHTVKLAFKMGKSFGLDNDDLLKLIWCKLRSSNKLKFNHWTVEKVSNKNRGWLITDDRYDDGTWKIPWDVCHVFEVVVTYLKTGRLFKQY